MNTIFRHALPLAMLISLTGLGSCDRRAPAVEGATPASLDELDPASPQNTANEEHPLIGEWEADLINPVDNRPWTQVRVFRSDGTGYTASRQDTSRTPFVYQVDLSRDPPWIDISDATAIYHGIFEIVDPNYLRLQIINKLTPPPLGGRPTRFGEPGDVFQPVIYRRVR
jgi:hypothetical protein